MPSPNVHRALSNLDIRIGRLENCNVITTYDPESGHMTIEDIERDHGEDSYGNETVTIFLPELLGVSHAEFEWDNGPNQRLLICLLRCLYSLTKKEVIEFCRIVGLGLDYQILDDVFVTPYEEFLTDENEWIRNAVHQLIDDKSN